jgi:hypothetical protein
VAGLGPSTNASHDHMSLLLAHARSHAFCLAAKRQIPTCRIFPHPGAWVTPNSHDASKHSHRDARSSDRASRDHLMPDEQHDQRTYRSPESRDHLMPDEQHDQRTYRSPDETSALIETIPANYLADERRHECARDTENGCEDKPAGLLGQGLTI